jgi:hypothetical protein
MAEQPDKMAEGSLTARFKRFLAPIEGTDCLSWTGTKRRTGHGVFMVAPGVNWASARVAWVIAHAEPLLTSQVIEPTCVTGNACVNGAHWRLARNLRRRPSRIARYSKEARADFVRFALHLGVSEVAKLFDIERRTLSRWLTEHRRTLNGSTHPAAVPAPAPGANEGVEA